MEDEKWTFLSLTVEAWKRVELYTSIENIESGKSIELSTLNYDNLIKKVYFNVLILLSFSLLLSVTIHAAHIFWTISDDSRIFPPTLGCELHIATSVSKERKIEFN